MSPVPSIHVAPHHGAGPVAPSHGDSAGKPEPNGSSNTGGDATGSADFATVLASSRALAAMPEATSADAAREGGRHGVGPSPAHGHRSHVQRATADLPPGASAEVADLALVASLASHQGHGEAPQKEQPHSPAVEHVGANGPRTPDAPASRASLSRDRRAASSVDGSSVEGAGWIRGSRTQHGERVALEGTDAATIASSGRRPAIRGHQQANPGEAVSEHGASSPRHGTLSRSGPAAALSLPTRASGEALPKGRQHVSPTDAPSEALGAHGQPLAGAGPSDGVAQSNSSNAADGLRSPIQTGSPVLPGVASQLLTVMSPLRTLASGVHVVSVALHPEGLGDVRATMTLNDGSMTLRLVPSTPEAAEAIRIALPELQQGLRADGTTATIVVGDPSGGGTNAGTSGNPATSSDGRFARDDAGPFQSAPSISTPASSSIAPPSARSSDSNALLDVRV